MTKEQEELVNSVRIKLLRSGYPPIFIVSLAELEAVEQSIIEFKEANGLEPVILCGAHGVKFKNCELVLEVR
jgi:hypothetical protein